MTRSWRAPALAVVLGLGLAACETADPNEPALMSTAPLASSMSNVGLAASGTPYVIAFKRSGIPEDAAEMIAAAGGELVRTIPQIAMGLAFSSEPDFAGKVSAGVKIDAVDPATFYSVPALGEPELVTLEGHEDGPSVDDVFYGTYGWNIRRVNAPAAWEVTTGSHETVVAVIDGGIASNHPDLAPNLVFADCFSVGVPCNPYPEYTYHGTHVAGTVAAAFGHGGVIGVGPDLGLASYSVFEPIEGCGICAYSFSSWSSLTDAADRGFQVANLSLGSLGANWNSPAGRLGWSRVTRYALQQGLVVVASAGNNGLDLNGAYYHTPSDANGVISVGATGIRPVAAYPDPDSYDVKADYSNWGAAVSLVAPGGDVGGAFLIASAGVVPDPECAATASCEIVYYLAGGTSMASPHVAGAVGLIRDAHPDLTAKQVVSLVKRTTEDLGDRQLFGHGMLDVAAAIR